MNHPESTPYVRAPKKQAEIDFEIRSKQIQSMGSSSRDHPFAQRPNADIDFDDFEVQQRLHKGDSRLEPSNSAAFNMAPQSAIAKQDSKLWEEQLKDVVIKFDAGGRPYHGYEPAPDVTPSIAEKPVESKEAIAVLNMLVKGFSLRNKRQSEIAARFSDDDIQQVRQNVRDLYSSHFDDEVEGVINVSARFLPEDEK